jgi:hypothetical protein
MKRLYPTLKNSQRVRVMVDGFGIYCTVAETASIFATSRHAFAVADVMKKFADMRQAEAKAGGIVPVGIGATGYSGTQVQIDLN